MIKANVVSITYSESVDGIPKLDLETYLEDPVVQELFCGADFWDGLDIIIMTKKEYEDMDSVSDVLRKSLLDEREKTKELEEENKDLKKKVERLKEDLFFFYKGLKYNERVSELEKEVEELNKSKSDTWLELNTVKAENEKLKDELNKKQRVVDIVMDVVDVCSDLKERVGIYENR